MKRFIIVIVVLLLVITATVSAFVYFTSTRTVSFSFGEGDYSITVATYSDEEIREVATLKETGSIRLTKGSYSYSVVGNNLDNSTRPFTVGDEDTLITITPEYSASYLSSLLEKETSAINSTLSNAYPNSQFTVTTLKLYEKGDWAAGTLSLIVDPRELPDNYRYVLKKDTAGWKIVIPPTIAINKSQYKDVPSAILYDLYN